MDFSEWSEARRRAWQIKDKNANAYYYRFNDPGEPQRNGKWTKEERLLFFNRMAEIGVDGKWGIFSKAIPGRVGYQCSNFYRHLIENKEIEDKNYILDDKGKAHYLFQKGICHKRKKNGEETANNDRPIVVKKQKQKNKKKRRSDDDDEGDDEEYIPSGSMELEQKKDNPLPGFIDSITGVEVDEPCISPDGYVLGKKTWSRILTSREPRNTCPFTKKPLNKRDLITLNYYNIADYAEQIKTRYDMQELEIISYDKRFID